MQQYYDVVVAGGGLAGISCLIELKARGLSSILFEKSPRTGGTWFSNSYPGSGCDTFGPAYSFQKLKSVTNNWRWSARYSSSGDIREYLNHCIQSLNLSDQIKINTRITGATYDAGKNLWQVTLNESEHISCRFFVMATGPLSRPHIPEIPGLCLSNPNIVHSSEWETKNPDWKAKRISVIGTGTSSVQMIPELAKECRELRVFQRTPAYCFPAGQRLLSPEEVKFYQSQPRDLYDQPLQGALSPDFKLSDKVIPDSFDISDPDIRQQLDMAWSRGGFSLLGAFQDLRPQLLRNSDINQKIRDYIHSKIKAVVNDPQTASQLCPAYPLLSKRPALSDTYYQTFNQSHVKLISLKSEPIQSVKGTAVLTNKQNYDSDLIILATGYMAMKGSFLQINPTGLYGSLADHWQKRPQTYMGLLVHGFPNLFLINGPLSPGPFSNLMTLSALQSRWIADAISKAGSESVVHVPGQNETDWISESQKLTEGTIFEACNSWYSDKHDQKSPDSFLLYMNEAAYREKLSQHLTDDFFQFNNGY